MPHANATLTERGRLRLARRVVDEKWPLRRAAERFQVSVTTAKRWSQRYRMDGAAGMADRSSRPRTSPNRTPAPVERKVLHLRRSKRLGPVRIGWLLGLPASTCHAILRRHHSPRLADLDHSSRETIRRYEHVQPGDLIHVDVKKLGNIPDGGGHRSQGRHQGQLNRTATPGHINGINGAARLGYAYLHTAIDEHSRLAYTEILSDETKETATGFWRRAHAWFSAHGITISRVLTDNGACYISRLWHQTCAELGVAVKKTRPYRPQTNGKVERFHRTLADEWAYAKACTSENARRKALPRILHTYNYHRHHSAIGGPPASRVPNLAGQKTYRAQLTEHALAAHCLAVLQAAGATPADVVRSVVYVVSPDSAVLSAVWRHLQASPLAEAFSSASTLLGVAALGYDGQLVEVDLTAAVPPAAGGPDDETPTPRSGARPVTG
ncbi:integrase catalytic protein [Actinoplanes sp. N902-109]|nr:integrase catalytic protein [Actinoplanes sp. N902-109]